MWHVVSPELLRGEHELFLVLRLAFGSPRQLSAGLSDHVQRLQRMPGRLPSSQHLVFLELLELQHVQRTAKELRRQHRKLLQQLRNQLPRRLLHAEPLVLLDLLVVHDLER
jgi:hypothetical protein